MVVIWTPGLSPRQILFSKVGVASPRSSGVKGEYGDGVGVRGRGGVLEFGDGGVVPAELYRGGFSGASRRGSPAGGLGWSPNRPSSRGLPAVGLRR